MFIANKKVLLDDAAKDFSDGIDGLNPGDVSSIKDGSFGDVIMSKKKHTQEDLNNALNDKKIIVATIQSLSARLKDETTRGPLLKWLKETCKFLMVDETQAAGSTEWDSVLDEINAPYRVFLSATPRRSDGATLKIFAYSGPLAYETTASEQIEKGRLCDLDIQYYEFDHKMYNDNDTDLNYVEMYNACIVHNEQRNKFITERVFEMLDEERQVLCLVQFIEHGHILKEMLLERGLEIDEIQFIWGETSDKTRTKAINEFREGKFKVFIGSTVADAGLNIPSISGVILCGAGNSDITHVQRIGRGARTFDYEKHWGYKPKFYKDAGDTKVTKIIDVIDNNVCFFKKQSKNRYYNAREEFGADRVHIVNGDQSLFRYRSKKATTYKDVQAAESLKEAFKAFESIKNKEIDTDTQVKEDKPLTGQFADFINAFKK